MSQRLDTVEARLDAILQSGRGLDNTLGIDAQAIAIPSGRYRRRARPTLLSNAGYPPEEFDRAYDLVWPETSDDPDPANEYSAPTLRTRVLELQVGHLYGESWISLIRHSSGTGETQAHAASYPYPRADNDCEEMRLAVCFPGLYQLASDDPFIVGITRVGATTHRDLGKGRLLSTTRLHVTLAERRGLCTPST